MTRLILLVALLLSSVLGCGQGALQIHAHIADSVAESANAALPILISRYRDEGFRELERVRAEGGSAGDARAAIERIKEKWKPIWQAWESLRVAQDSWATVIESDADPAAALAELKRAYCELQRVWPEDIPAVPLTLVRCTP